MKLNITVVGIAVSCLGLGATALSLPGLAQTTLNPMQDWPQNNPNDLSSVLNQNTGTGAASMMNMMNRLMMMDGRSTEEVSAAQQENISTAAEEFRARQRQQMQMVVPVTQPAAVQPAVIQPPAP